MKDHNIRRVENNRIRKEMYNNNLIEAMFTNLHILMKSDVEKIKMTQQMINNLSVEVQNIRKAMKENGKNKA